MQFAFAQLEISTPRIEPANAQCGPPRAQGGRPHALGNDHQRRFEVAKSGVRWRKQEDGDDGGGLGLLLS
jgi:hypothetical protein